jgi:hypothetical protein
MRVVRRETHHINMGNYEWVEFTVEAEDQAEGTAVPAMLDQLSRTTYEALKEDLERASLETAEKESYVHEWTTEE